MGEFIWAASLRCFREWRRWIYLFAFEVWSIYYYYYIMIFFQRFIDEDKQTSRKIFSQNIILCHNFSLLAYRS